MIEKTGLPAAFCWFQHVRELAAPGFMSLELWYLNRTAPGLLYLFLLKLVVPIPRNLTASPEILCKSHFAESGALSAPEQHQESCWMEAMSQRGEGWEQEWGSARTDAAG